MPLDPSIVILDLAVSPAFDTDGICFAATDAGPWATFDGGTTWTPAVPELAASGIATTAVAVSPAFANDGVAILAIPGGIGATSDGGRAWRFAQLPLPAPVVSSIAFSPAFEQDAVAFLGTVQDGVFRSDDGGKTWVPWNPGLLDLSVTALAISPDFQTDQTLLAGTTTGVFRSMNGGRRWTPVDFEPDSHEAVAALGVVRRGDQGLAALAVTEGGEAWSSADMGETWRRIDEQTGVGAVRAIVTEPAQAQVVVLGDKALAHSSDGGERWATVADLPVPASEIVAIAATGDSEGGMIAITSSGDMKRIFAGQG